MKKSYIVTHKFHAATDSEKLKSKVMASREIYHELLKYIEQKKESAA